MGAQGQSEQGLQGLDEQPGTGRVSSVVLPPDEGGHGITFASANTWSPFETPRPWSTTGPLDRRARRLSPGLVKGPVSRASRATA